MLNSKETKVFMIGWEWPPFNSGGLGVACQGLAKALSMRVSKVVFTLPVKVETTDNFVELCYPKKEEKISIYKFYSSFSAYSKVSVNCFEKSVKSGNSNPEKVNGLNLLNRVLAYADFVENKCLDYDFDVIHAHDWLSFPAAAKAGKKSGKPFIAHVHATEFDRCAGDNVNREVYEIERKGLEEADGIIAISRRIKNILIEKYGIDPEKINLIHNGIDPDYFKKTNDLNFQIEALKKNGNKVVLYVGRLTVQKGVEFLIRAAKDVVKHSNGKTYFVIVGSGELRDQLAGYAAELGISDKVLFPGFLRGKELAEVYRSADVLVMPSVSEPFGLIPLESLINGTPVVVSKQSGVSEVLTNALKVDFWDVKELANMILASLQYSSLNRYLKENGHKEVNGISWSTPAEKCLQYYQEFISK
ncbi:MAG: glycosyltransferase family 4 protein [Patescibacteria group bacterium]